MIKHSQKSQRSILILILFISFTTVLLSCTQQPMDKPSISAEIDTPIKDEVPDSSVRFIEITTPKGNFKVWTKRVGNNPNIKVLTLHGGPGATHEYYEVAEDFFRSENIEFYYYDQLGSYYSDQPDDSSLWVTERFVEEVEQVRIALNLTSDNFYLYGHSWGGILAIEYALKYQKNLKGLIISNMVASIPDYNTYAEEVLSKQIDPDVLKEIVEIEEAGDYDNPRYMELLIPHHYEKHILRIPAAEWPDAINRTFEHLNPNVYVLMQGPSEFRASGRLEKWDRKSDLSKINVPTLTIGGTHDSMDPEHMKWMATEVQNGRYLHCPNGSHWSMYDDKEIYFEGLIKFINDVNDGSF
ncbi:alpha/beta fold hydrolase [Candidatus Marinimicrobia bacterium MT.SAG.3]|nr:alpha/beta fold hydrolase [Candidatus Marinimicrobia bacterium MT.SAG.3]